MKGVLRITVVQFPCESESMHCSHVQCCEDCHHCIEVVESQKMFCQFDELCKNFSPLRVVRFKEAVLSEPVSLLV